MIHDNFFIDKCNVVHVCMLTTGMFNDQSAVKLMYSMYKLGKVQDTPE